MPDIGVVLGYGQAGALIAAFIVLGKAYLNVQRRDDRQLERLSKGLDEAYKQIDDERRRTSEALQEVNALRSALALAEAEGQRWKREYERLDHELRVLRDEVVLLKGERIRGGAA